MKPIYYRWAYSPTTGDVSLSHNHEGHPADISFHNDLAQQRPESDLLFGYAYRLDNGWKVTDADHKPADDLHQRRAVEKAIENHEAMTKEALNESSSSSKEARWIDFSTEVSD